MEDSGCTAGGYEVDGHTTDHHLIYVPTKEPLQERRSPSNVVYKTNLRTGKTERLTPPDGKIKDLQPSIYVMSLESIYLESERVIENAGWPSWGSETVIFSTERLGRIGVCFEPLQLTRYTKPKGDHYNPFVMDGVNCQVHWLPSLQNQSSQHLRDDVPRHFDKLQSPHEDVGLFRVALCIPSIFRRSSKLAFVDNELKAAWLANSNELCVVFGTGGADGIFSSVWNQKKDILDVCKSQRNSGDLCQPPRTG
ncbi:hypothetical protein ZWY2020_029451 [Hordeum vulgare]|nr:hypothetical protein ZWY2020_029451 [Hordeum vulgare]